MNEIITNFPWKMVADERPIVGEHYYVCTKNGDILQMKFFGHAAGQPYNMFGSIHLEGVYFSEVYGYIEINP